MKTFSYKENQSFEDKNIQLIRGFNLDQILDYELAIFNHDEKMISLLVVRLKDKSFGTFPEQRVEKGKQVTVNVKKEDFIIHRVSDMESIREFFTLLDKQDILESILVAETV